MKNDVDYRNELLTTWEDTYKKGQLTLWIFLALKDGPKYVNDIRDFILEFSEGTISCEEQSLYRALRKFNTSDHAGRYSDLSSGYRTSAFNGMPIGKS